MARCIVHVRTEMPPAEAFAYTSDLTNFTAWDPGVASVERGRRRTHHPESTPTAIFRYAWAP